MAQYSRSPHGGRGLKPRDQSQVILPLWSLPSRGAWIETAPDPPACQAGQRRSPHGGRGLKPDRGRVLQRCTGRSPHGGRGLKPQERDKSQ